MRFAYPAYALAHFRLQAGSHNTVCHSKQLLAASAANGFTLRVRNDVMAKCFILAVIACQQRRRGNPVFVGASPAGDC
jgi:hypothetical protein